MADLAQQTLQEYLQYSIITGQFIWIKKRPKANFIKIGDVAGRTIQNGYVQIGIEGKYYLAHRLAVLYVTGQFPVEEVDHINGDTSCNAWINLREATRIDNSRNCRLRKNNTSGHPGVYWKKELNKWVANIRHNGKQHYLGCFDDLDEAIKVRKEAAKLHNYHPNHGRSQ